MRITDQTSKPKVRTCLWFERDGLEAAKFFVSLLPGSALEIDPNGEEPLIVPFTLAGAPFQILNGGPHFELTEAASISVMTEDQAETDRLWTALTADGGQESQCGWLKDRWGLSWQLVPRILPVLLASDDREAAERVQKAMMEMNRLEIAALERAFRGD